MPEIFNSASRKPQSNADDIQDNPVMDEMVPIEESSQGADTLPPPAHHSIHHGGNMEGYDMSGVGAGGHYNEEESRHNRRHHRRHVNDYSDIMKMEEPSSSALDAYAPKPLNIFSFDSQMIDEPVLLLLRKHPITQVGKLMIVVVLVLLPLLFSNMPFMSSLPARYQAASYLFWYLMIIGFLIESFLTWFFNVYIITDERIIDVDFLSIVYKNVSSAKIDNIEDVTATTTGSIQSIFDFGTVKIQTAAEKTEFEFEDVPHPGKVTQFINEMILEEEREKVEGRIR